MPAESLFCNAQHSAKLFKNKNDELKQKSFAPGSPTVEMLSFSISIQLNQI